MSVRLMTMVFRSTLDSTTKLVALKLADAGNDDGSSIYPGIKRIARLTSLTERTVQKAIRAMEEMGVLRLVSEKSVRGTREYAMSIRAIYAMANPIEMDLERREIRGEGGEPDSPPPTEGGERGTPGGANVGHPTHPITHPSSSLRSESRPASLKAKRQPSEPELFMQDRPSAPPVAPPPPGGRDLTAEFREFYAVYPLKKGKIAAEKAFEKARRKFEFSVILAGAQRFAGERMGEDPRYTAHPSTWLNEGRWEDEPDRKPAQTPMGRFAQGARSLPPIPPSDATFLAEMDAALTARGR